jgi:hypothetical protein
MQNILQYPLVSLSGTRKAGGYKVELTGANKVKSVLMHRGRDENSC